MTTELPKRFLFGLVSGLGLGLGIALIAVAYSSMAGRLNHAGELNPDLIEVQNAVVVRTTGGAWCARFEVVNRSGERMSQYGVDVDLLDASGQFLGDATKQFNGTLRPGEVDGMTVTQEDRVPFGLSDYTLQGVASCRVRVDYALSNRN